MYTWLFILLLWLSCFEYIWGNNSFYLIEFDYYAKSALKVSVGDFFGSEWSSVTRSVRLNVFLYVKLSRWFSYWYWYWFLSYFQICTWTATYPGILSPIAGGAWPARESFPIDPTPSDTLTLSIFSMINCSAIFAIDGWKILEVWKSISVVVIRRDWNKEFVQIKIWIKIKRFLCFTSFYFSLIPVVRIIVISNC